jgi:hypothetical protein
MVRRKAFVVGRTDRRSMTLLVLRVLGGPILGHPILGPWTLRAVVSPN